MPLGSAAVTFFLSSAPPDATTAANNNKKKKSSDQTKQTPQLPIKTVEEIIDILHGQHCGNRPVRVQKPMTSNSGALDLKRRISFGTGGGGSGGGGSSMRYFVTDISCKCHACGQVGHLQQDCFNDALPIPCHLCAGLDHDAGDCPNIICYRCGKFGHHSRDCMSGNRPRPIVCFQCGSLQHDLLKCPDILHARGERGRGEREKEVVVNRFESKVEDVFVRCMNCSSTGHIMCQRLPWDRSWER